MTRTRVLAATLLVLSLAACTVDAPKSAPPSLWQPSVQSTSPTPTVTYRHTELDLCAEADLAPLKSLRLTVQQQNGRPNFPLISADHQSTCHHTLRTADGHYASLVVGAVVLDSAEHARRTFDAKQARYKSAGTVSGPWQAGAASTFVGTTGKFKNSEYGVRVLDGNLYLEASLAVHGTSHTPLGKMDPIVTEIATTTFDTVARAWR
ncbi:MAG TPA: hypothetical protein VFO77_05350 [Actinoplanes sp.]|nr:hypothetical protein [Actinoplanes sp.]